MLRLVVEFTVLNFSWEFIEILKNIIVLENVLLVNVAIWLYGKNLKIQNGFFCYSITWRFQIILLNRRTFT